jgi:hypothetical protein
VPASVRFPARAADLIHPTLMRPLSSSQVISKNAWLGLGIGSEPRNIVIMVHEAPRPSGPYFAYPIPSRVPASDGLASSPASMSSLGAPSCLDSLSLITYSLTFPYRRLLRVQLILGVCLDPEHLRSTLPGWVVISPNPQGLWRASFSPHITIRT